ncbi:MAG TPA: hypothetical protein VH105_00680 [Burkholderiales bacterium]|jgi:hypothetical protein|nr:hypothetical protein [Burkholderiales bacterium]
MRSSAHRDVESPGRPARDSARALNRLLAHALAGTLACACALLPLAAGAKGGHGGGHGGHGSSSSGSAVSFSGSHSRSSGAITPMNNAAASRSSTSATHGSNCASRDERGNCQGYNARAIGSHDFGQSGAPISVP